jgi:predicted transcriptional regulator
VDNCYTIGMTQKRQLFLERVMIVRKLIDTDDKTQSDVAELLNVSRQRVNQLYHYKKQETRRKTQNHIAQERIIKPEKCHFCKATKGIEAHHKDYKDAINVVWVCKPCHTRIHYGDLSILRPKDK